MICRIFAALATPFALTFASCVTVDEGTASAPAAPARSDDGQAMAPQSSPVSYGQPLVSQIGTGQVTILEGSRTVSVCSTALPNVEEAKFITEQEQIVVKSRGNHGPATVQLFDTKTGAEKSRVAAFEIRDGSPAWAAGMGE